MSDWIRIGDEENDAPWCRELDGGEGVQIAADEDTERERVIGLLYSELDAIPHVAAYVARIAELEAELERRAGAETIDSWQACPACGDLAVVANQFGWVCTRCGAHREWNSETCPGDYCEDGCGKVVVSLFPQDEGMRLDVAFVEDPPPSAPCAGEYCEDGCDKCVGTP